MFDKIVIVLAARSLLSNRLKRPPLRLIDGRPPLLLRISLAGPIGEHRELCSMLCSGLDGSGVWGRMDTHICIAESLAVHLKLS